MDTNEQPEEEVQSARFRDVPKQELLSPQFGVCPDCKEALTSSCDTDAFNYPRSSLNPFTLVSMEFPLCQHDWLSYWPLVIINAVSSPSPLWRSKGEAESPILPITWLVPLAARPLPEVIRRCSYYPSHLVNSKGFRSSVSRTRGEDQRYIYYVMVSQW